MSHAILIPTIIPNQDVVKATQFCLEYQRKFRRDVFLDLVCYRRHGHNELDDPTFTNPLLYKTIHATKTMPDTYADEVRNDVHVLQSSSFTVLFSSFSARSVFIYIERVLRYALFLFLSSCPLDEYDLR